MEGNPQQCYQVLMYFSPRAATFPGTSSSSTADQKSVNVVELHLLRRQSLGALVPGSIHCSCTPCHGGHTVSSARGMGWGQGMQGHDRLLHEFCPPGLFKWCWCPEECFCFPCQHELYWWEILSSVSLEIPPFIDLGTRGVSVSTDWTRHLQGCGKSLKSLKSWEKANQNEWIKMNNLTFAVIENNILAPRSSMRELGGL